MTRSNKKDLQQISPYSMRFTKKEREQLNLAAAGLSLSAFIQMRLFGKYRCSTKNPQQVSSKRL